MSLKNLSLFLLLFVSNAVFSQAKSYTSAEAYGFFKHGDFVQAQAAYAFLLQSNDGDVKNNYYYGVCLVETNADVSQGLRRLKYAALKGVTGDIYFHLGRAYQLRYQFGEAKSNYERYLKTAAEDRKALTQLYIDQCVFGESMITKAYSLEVLSRDTTSKENVLSLYKPSKDVGKVMLNKNFFESGVEPNSVLYLTERGDEVYFSLPNAESSSSDLYKMEKLMDGWSDNKRLSEVCSPQNDIQPFLLLDGVTLFFASDRPGGMGGFDIYKSIYDSSSKLFSEPVNMGLPFNSPKDDYLFVTDGFSEVAWFASNRETTLDKLMVYKFVWNDEVVKNTVVDMNQVSEAAQLKLTTNKGSLNTSNSVQQNGAMVPRETEKPSFTFVVDAQTQYTDLSQFKSQSAKTTFEKGWSMQMQKDSLSQKMGEKRYVFVHTNSDVERNKMVNEILALEKQVYSLDEEIENLYFLARRAEQAKISELKNSGVYENESNREVSKTTVSYLDLIPTTLTYYSSPEFEQRIATLNQMYIALFDANDISKLHHADSLFVWANVLSLESSKLLESAASADEMASPVVSSPFRKSDGDVEDIFPSVDILSKSKEYKYNSLQLYHKSLDVKYEVYGGKVKALISSNSTSDLTYLEDAHSKANAYYRTAAGLMNELAVFDANRYERAGAMKKNGVSELEKGLSAYGNSKKETGTETAKAVMSVKKAEVTSIPKTYQELQGVDKSISPKENMMNKEDGLVFKIQIGVFKNKPNADALNAIPPISEVYLADRGLTKYFSGRYKTFGEANSNVAKVQEAGFSGAFVVVFKDGVQITLTEELKK